MRHTALKKEIDDQGDIALTILGDLTSSFLKSVLDSSPDCIKIIGVDGCLTYMSENGQEIMEVDDFAMISGRHWASLWPDDNRHLIPDALAQVKHGRACRFEAHCPTAKGRDRWWDVSVSPVIDEEGELQQILSISRDITQRVRHEQELKDKEAELERLARRQAQELRQMKLKMQAIAS